jgi:hypothetical protein
MFTSEGMWNGWWLVVFPVTHGTKLKAFDCSKVGEDCQGAGGVRFRVIQEIINHSKDLSFPPTNDEL